MSTLAKLRALHEDVCHAWRLFEYPEISEGEAYILNIGFMLLEETVRSCDFPELSAADFRDEVSALVTKYVELVYSQFDHDADIVTKGDK